MTLSNTQVQVSIKGDLTSPQDLGNALFPTNLIRGTAFDPGTGAGQVDRIWTDTRTITASSSEDIDLAGALVDALGGAAVFARVKALMVFASPANVNNVVVGGVTNGLSTILQPAATGLVVVRPGGFFAVSCGGGDATGYAVTGATADLLHVANSGAGTSVTYDVVVIGCSA